MKPRNPHTITGLEGVDSRPDSLDESDNFVTRYDIASVNRKVAYGDVEVGAAHSARENTNK
ncbi:hypothetical protein GCM10020255_086420 [Rhodococcus baikonurensis]